MNDLAEQGRSPIRRESRQTYLRSQEEATCRISNDASNRMCDGKGETQLLHYCTTACGGNK